MENELLFLGLLVDSPKHGYEIKRLIQEDLSPNIGVKIKSIYYPLKKMEAAGLIVQQSGREGKWPQKFVYRITSKGRKRFDDLMGESFVSIERPFFQMDLSLYFLPLTDKTMVKRRLKARHALLRKVARELSVLKAKAAPTPKSAFLILQHDLDLVEAEIASTDKLINQI